jgi:TBC1 domain family protein 5
MHALLRNLMRAPDGSYDESYLLSGQAEPLTPAGKPEINWEKNNPLSLDEQVKLPRRSRCP